MTLCLTSVTVLNTVKPLLTVQRILSYEHLMPSKFTEKSLKEDLMERLGKITSHLSKGHKKLSKSLTFRNNYDIYSCFQTTRFV